MMKKQILSLVLVVFMAMSMIGCGSSATEGSNTSSGEDEYVVQIPGGAAICSAPLYVAIEKGYLDEYGVKYNYFNSDVNDWDLVAAGKGDLVYGLLPTCIQRIANGFDISIPMGAHYGCINVVADKDSGIKSIADLKGKKVAIPGSMGSDPAILLQRMLAANNIAVSDVDLQVYTNADLETALLKGYVDAFVSWDPYATSVSRKTGNPIIFNQSTDELTKDEFCCVFGLRNDFVKEHPEVAKNLMKAIAKATDYIDTNPQEVAKLIYEKGYVVDGDYELNGELLDSYNYSAKYQKAKDSFIDVTDDLAKLGIISINVSPQQLADKVFVNIAEIE